MVFIYLFNSVSTLATLTVHPDTPLPLLLDAAQGVPVVFWPSLRSSCITHESAEDCVKLIESFTSQGITTATTLEELTLELITIQFDTWQDLIVSRVFKEETPLSDMPAAEAELANATHVDRLRSYPHLLAVLGPVWADRESADRSEFWSGYFSGLPSKVRRAFLNFKSTCQIVKQLSEICKDPDIKKSLWENSSSERLNIRQACVGDLQAFQRITSLEKPMDLSVVEIRKLFWNVLAYPISAWLDLPLAIADFPAEINPRGKCRCLTEKTAQACLPLLVDFIEIADRKSMHPENAENPEAVLHIFGQRRMLLNVDLSRTNMRKLSGEAKDAVFLASKQIGKFPMNIWRCPGIKQFFGKETRLSEPYHTQYDLINQMDFEIRTEFW